MPINEFVEDGLFQHRRVNDPDLQPHAQGGRRPAHPQRLARSERLGITGKLDLLEEKATRSARSKTSGGGAQGRQRPARFWENDAVQLCAQACCSRKAWACRSRRDPLLRRHEGPRRGPV